MKFKKCETFLKNESLQYLEDLAEKIRENRVVLFVGAGLSRNARRKDRTLNKEFPLWPDLMQKMLIKLYGEGDKWVENQKYDYMNVPDKFEAQFGRNSLIQLLDEALEDEEFEPGDIHQLISKFNWEVITTNFDTLVERGFELSNKRPNLIYEDSDLSFINKPRIFKMNGCIKHARSQIIITGEDFRTYSDKKPLMELYIKKCFIDSTVLFVGFSLEDPAFKMIHGWVRDRLLEKKANRFAYSVQLTVDEATKKIWYARGIRFIELFPNGDINEIQIRHRHDLLFIELYEKQKPKSADDGTKDFLTDPEFPTLVKFFRESLKEIVKKARKYDDDCQIESSAAQEQLETDIQGLIKIKPSDLSVFFGICEEPFKEKIKDEQKQYAKKEEVEEKIFVVFARLIQQYLCPDYRENILYGLLKRVLLYLEKYSDFKNKQIPIVLSKVFNDIMIKSDKKVVNPDIWVMALYLGLRSGIHMKLPPIEFFKDGFDCIYQNIHEPSSEYVLSIDLQRYWLFVLLLIGPFSCAKNFLDISRKTEIKKSYWDIPKEIQFHLVSFFEGWENQLGLFLDAVNQARTAKEIEAFYLLDTFLFKYESLGFSDLFIRNTYKELSGEFRERSLQYVDQISGITYPITSNYLKNVVQVIFKGFGDGKSLLYNDISQCILSFPNIILDESNIKQLKDTSVADLFLLVVMFDLPSSGKKSHKDFERFMKAMICNGIINVSYFLELLLLRLEGEEAISGFDQKKDSGVSRFFPALTTFLYFARPYLNDKELLKIKSIIERNLASIQDYYIQEWFVHTIVYISSQLPEEDFSTIYKTIFSLADVPHHSSLGLKHIKLQKKDLVHPYLFTPYDSELRRILSLSLDRQGTSLDRDFIEFLLNHKRDELFTKDNSIDKALEVYLVVRYEDTSHLSFQWLMDYQRFIDQGYFPYDDERKKQIRKYIKKAFNNEAVGFEWRQVSINMIPVYIKFADLFDIKLVRRIIDEYFIDVSGEIKKFRELDYEARLGYVKFLKEVYLCQFHSPLKPKIIEKIKQIVAEGFNIGGDIGLFWSELDKKEQKKLANDILAMWHQQNNDRIERVITSSGDFLMYETDSDLKQKLSDRLINAPYTGSKEVKVSLIKLFIKHASAKTDWYKSHEAQILDLLNYFKNEKELTVLRVLVKWLKEVEIDQIKEVAEQLEKRAPYAEIRREVRRLLKE